MDLTKSTDVVIFMLYEVVLTFEPWKRITQRLRYKVFFGCLLI